jgi:hypothetical protein
VSDDILSRIDDAMARNAERFHPFGPPVPPVRRPYALPYRCRGCRLWIAQDVKLCGPCSALPPCRAERLNERTERRMACLRPDGHDGQHEEVQGSAWGPDDCTPPPDTTPWWRRMLPKRSTTGGTDRA